MAFASPRSIGDASEATEGSPPSGGAGAIAHDRSHHAPARPTAARYAHLANTRCATPGSVASQDCRPHGTYAACLGGQTVSAYEQNTQQSPPWGFSVSPQPVQR